MTGTFEMLASDGNFMILNLLLQVTLLLGVAVFLASRFEHNAATRYGILFPALVSLLLLVLASLFLQFRDMSLVYLPVALQEVSSSTTQAEFIQDPVPAMELDFGSAQSNSSVSAGTGMISVYAPDPYSIWALLLRAPLYSILALIWVGGFLVFTLGILRSLHHIERISHNSRPLCIQDRRRLQQLISQDKVQELRIGFRISDQITSPVLTGFFSSIIFLPRGFIESLSEGDLESVLVHELAHIERKDVLANLLQKTIVAIFWFHPLIHLMDKMISRTREEICDNYVLAKTEPLAYSEALLRANTLGMSYTSKSADLQLAVGIFSGEWRLEQRIAELLNDNREKSMELKNRTNQLTRALIISFALFLAACRVGAQDVDEQVITGPSGAESESVQAQLAQQVEQYELQTQELEMAERQLRQQMQELRKEEEELRAVEQELREQIKRREQEVNSQAASVPARPVLIQTQAPLDQDQSANLTMTLGPRVMEVIEQIQELMSPADSAVEANMNAAKAALDSLYNERYEQMNDFEKLTLFNFYTNYYLALENYQEAANIFEQMLDIENVHDEAHLRILRSLGQLHAALENWPDSISYYEQWQQAAARDDLVVSRGLSYANYQLQQFDYALPHWLAYMKLRREQGEEIGRDDYMYLNGLYFTLESWEDALETTKEMILKFNDPKDWSNLRVLYKTLDEEVAEQIPDAA